MLKSADDSSVSEVARDVRQRRHGTDNGYRGGRAEAM